MLTATPMSARRGDPAPCEHRAKPRSRPGSLRDLLVLAACAAPLFHGAASAWAQVPPASRPASSAHRSGCGFLDFTTKELAGALKECDAFAPFFQPDANRLPAGKGLFAPGPGGDEMPTQFGQNRLVQRFPLYMNSLYPQNRNDDETVDSATASQAAPGGTVRGGMIEENTDDIGQPTVRVGTVTWAAQPPLVSAADKVSRIVGSLAIGGRKTALNLALSPGSAGAPLALEVMVTGEEGAELGVPRIRRTGERSGEPMDMVGRRQADGTYLFIPAADSQSLQNITSALLNGQWIDVPVRPRNETPYTLTMELARPGKALMRRAFEDWRLAGLSR